MSDINALPLISVIVPVYNVKEFLPKCIESIIKQSYKNLEIILVDDGSTDGSGSECELYKDLDRRIKVIHKSNGGLSDARNIGIMHATGRYIGFVDGDDYICEDMYARMYDVMMNTDVDVVICKAARDISGVVTNSISSNNISVIENKEEMIREVFVGSNNITTSACVKLYKIDIFENIRFPIGKMSEDAFIILDVIKHTNRLAVVDQELYIYRSREGSITRNRKWSSVITDTIEAYTTNYAFIKRYYPNILEAAEFRLLFAYRDSIYVGSMAIDKDKHKKELWDMRMYLLKNFYRVVANKYNSFYRIIATILIIFVPDLYCKIKRIM